MFAGIDNHIPFAHDMSVGSSIMLALRSFRRACFIVQPKAAEVLGLDSWGSNQKRTSHARLALCLVLC
jgi:hypothetical protein